MADFTELEYKYRADDISFAAFKKLMNDASVKSYVEASSWDYYYKPLSDKVLGFIRFRDSKEKPELTRKLKTKDSNNYQRIEWDVPLDRSKIDYATVNGFVETIGFKENFLIFKNCFIYFLDNVNYVYYIVYDENLRERGRFIEVEVNKDRVRDLQDTRIEGDTIKSNPNGAIDELNRQEKLLASIGITPQNRMKKSLFELFERN